MNLTREDLRADVQYFDNTEAVVIYPFVPATETYSTTRTVTGLNVQTGESAGLTMADTNVSDGGILDGRLTKWILWDNTVKKLDKIVAGGQSYIVDVSTKMGWGNLSECMCRDA